MPGWRLRVRRYPGVGCSAVGRLTNDTGLLNHRESIIYPLIYVLLLPFDGVLHSNAEEPLRSLMSKRVSSEAWRMSDHIEVKMGSGVDRAPKGAGGSEDDGRLRQYVVHSSGWVQDVLQPESKLFCSG